MVRQKTVIIWHAIWHHKVYNIEQTTGLRIGNLTEPSTLFIDESTIHNILNRYKNPPRIVRSENPAYIPLKDIIEMPHKSKFITIEEYYNTLFHELIHSTGHPDRLNRLTLNENHNYFENYAKEELIAELGSVFLCALFGFHHITRRNSAGYLDYWLDFLREDPGYLLRAVNAAQRAVELITGELNITSENEQTTQQAYPDYEQGRNLLRA
jgi:antirestriction protein ArdC